MRPVVRLPASATRALPRSALLALCVIYVASGLFGRDPWKNEDAVGFGMMWTMVNGGMHDWLLPNLFGKVIANSGPLVYWLGALAIRFLNGWIDPSNASRVVTGAMFTCTCSFVWYSSYLLGRRAEVQPFKYVFGGEPEPRDYGRTLADGALLILLASFGLAERGHETTPEVGQLACVAMLAYGLIRSIDKPIQGTLWWGVALGLMSLCATPVMSATLLIAVLLATVFCRELQAGKNLAIGIPLALAISLLWPLIALWALPAEAPSYLKIWALDAFNDLGAPTSGVFFYALKNLPLFAWPAWPLAVWSLYSWPGFRRAPHVVVPSCVAAALLVLVLLQNHQSNLLFLMLLPPLAVLASFGLPTLKRGAVNAFDWFALLSFTILGSFIWLVWIAGLTGYPPSIAHNLARLVPGFKLEFHLGDLIAALLVTLSWILLVQWRLARHPKVLWRSVVLSSAGTTLTWVLLMTLWLPIVNYGRTYRDVATQIATHLPADYTCISPVRLGDAQLASFAYFGNMHFAFGANNCDVILRQDSADYNPPVSQSPFTWTQTWEGRRPADRDERFRLYIRTERHPLKRQPVKRR